MSTCKHAQINFTIVVDFYYFLLNLGFFCIEILYLYLLIHIIFEFLILMYKVLSTTLETGVALGNQSIIRVSICQSASQDLNISKDVEKVQEI